MQWIKCVLYLPVYCRPEPYCEGIYTLERKRPRMSITDVIVCHGRMLWTHHWGKLTNLEGLGILFSQGCLNLPRLVSGLQLGWRLWAGVWGWGREVGPQSRQTEETTDTKVLKLKWAERENTTKLGECDMLGKGQEERAFQGESHRYCWIQWRVDQKDESEHVQLDL